MGSTLSIYNAIQNMEIDLQQRNLFAAMESFWHQYCYRTICTCSKPNTSSQILCNYRKSYHCHLSRRSPRFSDGERSTTGEASPATSRDQIASNVAKPIAPSLGYLSQMSMSVKLRKRKCFGYLPGTRTIVACI
jgi:hypothetical protein